MAAHPLASGLFPARRGQHDALTPARKGILANRIIPSATATQAVAEEPADSEPAQVSGSGHWRVPQSRGDAPVS
jgi:hypothetical protein